MLENSNKLKKLQENNEKYNKRPKQHTVKLKIKILVFTDFPP